MNNDNVIPCAVTLDTLRHLALSGALESSRLIPRDNRWYITCIGKGNTVYILKSTRDKPRLFSEIVTALKVCKSFFQPYVIISLSDWNNSSSELDI